MEAQEITAGRIAAEKRLNTASSLQFELVEELKRIFSGVLLKKCDGTYGEPNVYPQRLPLAQNDDEDEMSFAPYVTVILNDFSIDSWDEPKKIKVIILMCAWDGGDERTGDRDNSIIMDKILERFGKFPEIGNFTLDLPIEGAWQEEDTYPYFYSALELNFLAPTYRREDDLA